MKQYYYSFTMIICLVLPNYLWAQNHTSPIVLTSGIEILPQEQVAYIEDPTGEMSFEQIQQKYQQGKYQLLPEAAINFGMSQSTFWLIWQSHQMSEEKYAFKLYYPLLDYVDFYYEDEKKQWKCLKGGDKLPFHERKINDKAFLFELNLKKGETKTFFVKIKNAGITRSELSFVNLKKYLEKRIYEDMFWGILYGMYILLIAYNLLQYRVLKEKSYLFYIGFIFFNGIVTSTVAGHFYQFITFRFPLLNEKLIAISALCSVIFINKFTNSFLNTKQHLRWYRRIINPIIITAYLLLVFYLLSNQYGISVMFGNLLMLFSSLIIIWVSIRAVQRNVPSAEYFLIANLFVLGAGFIGTAINAGIIPNIPQMKYVSPVALAIQGTLFSLALADKFRKIKNELLQTQQEANQMLESKVKQRTQEIENLNSELLTQNEELHQSQEEILAQREFISRKNAELEAQNTKINSSIEAAKLIQKAILPYVQKEKDLLGNYFVIYMPKDIVSGDFYWINKINQKTFIAVIDCTGHGVAGAFMTLIATNLLDKIVKVWQIHEPNQILETLHQEIRIVLQQDENKNHNGMDASIVVLEPTPEGSTAQITFAGAKNDLYLNTHDHIIQTIAGTRKGIGGLQNEEIQFQNHHFIVPKNTWIYLTTDGFIDQNNVKRKKIGKPNFIQWLQECDGNESNEQKNILSTKLQAHMKNTQQRDDICLVGFQIGDNHLL